jgi:hypothetical protein
MRNVIGLFFGPHGHHEQAKKQPDNVSHPANVSRHRAPRNSRFLPGH